MVVTHHTFWEAADAVNQWSYGNLWKTKGRPQLDVERLGA